MKISIIVLHFGNIKTTQLCIQSLYQVEKHPFSLIVVNNTETLYAAKDFTRKKITILNNKKNLGFAAGVNVGIRFALHKKADVVCLLNNDTCITKPILAQLSSHFKTKDVGIVGPAIEFVKDNTTLYDIGGKVQPFFLRTVHEEVKKIKNKNSKDVTYISGCCMLIRKEVFTKIGLFDESFFLYYEDADFCLRSRENLFRVVVDPAVVIHHELSKSAGKLSPFTIYNLLRSNITFGNKYAKNIVQKVAQRLFVLFQAAVFVKANPRAGIVIGKALLK
ncbi:MAG TPA: glycosyltransferase family 2 protein [Candidatus Eisenbacteria bacterium]|nr:glycosyltransferase family 2 protein [Candidatus Eisenbacteria bacterium]